MERKATLVGRGSGITHSFEQSRSLCWTAGELGLTIAEPLCVLPSARNGSAAQLGLAIRVRARSIAPLIFYGHSGASPHQKSSPDIPQYSNTPALYQSARLESRTACPTKPKLYIANRLGRPRKRGALHETDGGEVGRTKRLALNY